MEEKFKLNVLDENDESQRLDSFLVENLPITISRTYIQKLIKEKYVLVNDKEKSAHYLIHFKDKIVATIPEPKTYNVEAQNIPLDIIYEDDHLLVVNKPVGLVVHPAYGHNDGTLVNALLYHCSSLSGINGVLKPGIVHRLDKDTSGLMLVAKDDETHRGLADQLKQRKISKTYLTICAGQFPKEQQVVSFIARSKRDRKQMTVVQTGGREAISYFKIKEPFKHYTLLEVNIETGRTHQIRVHLKHLGYPVLGDSVYGRPHKQDRLGQIVLPIKRQALHAASLKFIHPISKKEIYLECPLPEDMEKVLELLKK